MDHFPAYPSGVRLLVDEVMHIAATVTDRAAALQQAAAEARRRAVLAQRAAERARASAIRAFHECRRREQRMAAAARSTGRVELGTAARAPSVISSAAYRSGQEIPVLTKRDIYTRPSLQP